MPVTTVIGGQYGSEGKGKVAHFLVREQDAVAAVRVGGPNSGHTSVDASGNPHVLQQVPVAALDGILSLIGPGSYVNPAILLEEIRGLGLDAKSVCVDYRAMVLTEDDLGEEARNGLGAKIGSTCSGTGAAVQRRITRSSQDELAVASREIRPYVGDSVAIARDLLKAGKRVIVEGTQGFGLSLLHSPHYPYVTARDTSAAGAVSEAGLSPLDVDEVVMVLRTFPIRVAGNSGPFDSEEVDWETIGAEAGFEEPPREFTSVTGNLRRVARFDPAIVIRAIEANRPSRIALNHLDYVDSDCRGGEITTKARRFIRGLESALGSAEVDLAGFGPRPGDLTKVDHAATSTLQ